MYNAVLISLAVSLMLTLFLETVFYLVIGKRDVKDLKLLLLVNLLTNPIVVVSFWLTAIYTQWNAYLAIIPLEFFAVIVEGWYYKKHGRSFKRPFLFSLCANAFSFGAGMLIQIVISTLATVDAT